MIINAETEKLIKEIVLSQNFHFSLKEVAEFAARLTKKNITSEQSKVYRFAKGPKLPVIWAIGQSRVLRLDVLKYLGLDMIVDLEAVKMEKMYFGKGDNENGLNLEYRQEKRMAGQ